MDTPPNLDPANAPAQPVSPSAGASPAPLEPASAGSTETPPESAAMAAIQSAHAAYRAQVLGAMQSAEDAVANAVRAMGSSASS